MSIEISDPQIYGVVGSVAALLLWFGRDYYARLQNCEKQHKASNDREAASMSRIATLEGEMGILKMVAGNELANAVATKVLSAIHEAKQHEGRHHENS